MTCNRSGTSDEKTLRRSSCISALSVILVVMAGANAWGQDASWDEVDAQPSIRAPHSGFEQEDIGMNEDGQDWFSCMESTGMGVVGAATGTVCAAVCLAQPLSAPLCAACLATLAGEGALGTRALLDALDRCEDWMIDVVPDLIVPVLENVFTDPGAIRCSDTDWNYSISYYPFRGHYEALDRKGYYHDGFTDGGNHRQIPVDFCNGSIEINLYNYCRTRLIKHDNMECVPRCIDTFIDEAKAYCSIPAASRISAPWAL